MDTAPEYKPTKSLKTTSIELDITESAATRLFLLL
jgi:hypothetical protein